MSLTNFDIIKIVNLAINKDISGNAFTPDEYKTLINTHSMRLFREKLGVPQEYQPNAPIGREGVSITKENEMALLPFQVVETIATVDGQASLSGKNVAYISTVLPSPQIARGFDECFPFELGDRLKDPITKPTEKDPVMVWRSPILVDIYPTSVANVTFYYYRYPTQANFTITPNVNTLLPEYTSITELQWSDPHKIEIAYRVIREAGVNIEKQDAVALSNQIITTGK